MRELFEILSICDWVTPVKGFVEDFVNDPTPLQSNSWTFFIPYGEAVGGGHNARQIERALDSAGVKHWGSQITGGEYFFSVPKDQAHAAELILSNLGVPVGLGGGAPLPQTEMRSAVGFVPVGLVRVGVSLPARLFIALVRLVFG